MQPTQLTRTPTVPYTLYVSAHIACVRAQDSTHMNRPRVRSWNLSESGRRLHRSCSTGALWECTARGQHQHARAPCPRGRGSAASFLLPAAHRRPRCLHCHCCSQPPGGPRVRRTRLPRPAPSSTAGTLSRHVVAPAATLSLEHVGASLSRERLCSAWRVARGELTPGAHRTFAPRAGGSLFGGLAVAVPSGLDDEVPHCPSCVARRGSISSSARPAAPLEACASSSPARAVSRT
jgi:hypothetical protein